MNPLDWLLLFILAVTAVMGYQRGLVDSAITLAAIYVSLVIGALFAGYVIVLLPISVESAALSTVIGYVVIFAVVILASRVVTAAANKLVSPPSIEWINKLGGLAMGVIVWAFLASALITVGARFAYVVDSSDSDYSSFNRAQRSLVKSEIRRQVDDQLTGSAIVPELIKVMPRSMLGIAPSAFAVSNGVLEQRVAD